jgi:hypothetical protein
MAEQIQNGKKSDEIQTSRELLAKSAALKEKSVLLKKQMDATAKACGEFLKSEKQNSSPEDKPQ